MRVSVVVANHDYGRFLPDAIESALAQSHPDTEVVVVDDGSTDGSAAVFAGYGERIVAVLKERGGQGSAVNAGFAACTGDAVIFLDADDLLLDGAAAAAAEILAEPGVAKVQWPMLVGDEDGRPTGAIHPDQPLDDGDLRDRLWTCPRYTSPPQSANAYPRWYLERVLPMPEEPFPAAADAYLYQLVIPFGPVRTVAEPLSTYRRHGANRSAQRRVDRMRRWARADDAAWQSLAATCSQLGVGAASPDDWRRRSWNHGLVAVDERLAALIPGEPFVLVDDNGSFAMEADVLRRPRQWWGLPADGAAACEELERFRSEGARYAVVGWPAYWWLACYGELREHLARYPLVAADERLRVHDLRSPRAAAPRRPAATGERIPVVTCTYARPERLERTLAMLAEQEGCRVELHVWNNNAEIAGLVDRALAAVPALRGRAHHSAENVGPFGAFHLARELADRFPRVVFVDDDVDFAPNAIATLAAELRPRTLGSFHAFRLCSPEDYFDRRELSPGERADYCGTAGMVCDTAIFRDPQLFACPERFRFIQDLWLSHLAAHRHGWRLFKSAAAFHLHVDDRELWLELGERKSEFLRWLVARGWRIGAGSRPAWPAAGRERTPGGSPA